MFSLYQLKIFQTVAQEGSISRAAERLYLTQPAVSQHVRALEKDLGVRLFERGPRGVTLTPSGEVLRDYARCLLRLADEARQAVAQADGIEKDQLRIGASPGAGVYLLPGWIHSFHKQHPSLSITLTTATTPAVIQAIEAQQIEIGIVEGELNGNAAQANRETFDAMPLWDEVIAIIVGRGHPWWELEHVAVSALAEQGFVVREEGSLTRAWEAHTLGAYGIKPRIVASFDSPVAIKQAVISGLGAALLPQFSIQQELAADILHAVHLTEGPLARTLRLLCGKESRDRLAVRAFLAYLAGEFPHLPLQLGGPDEAAGLLSRLQALRQDQSSDPTAPACPT